MSEDAPRRRRRWWPRRWHRWLGAGFALPLLWLTATGLVLNHADGLGLNTRTVSSKGLVKKYGMIPEGEPRGTKAGRFTLEEWGGILFLGGKVLEDSGVLVGAVAKPAELIVATESALFVYDAQGGLVDRLDETSLPAVPVSGIGRATEGSLIVKSGTGSWKISDDYLDHEVTGTTEGVVWSEVAAVGAEGRARLEEALAEEAGIPWSRVVLDLHSGNLFGGVGRTLVDLTGVAVLVLTLLGFRLLFRRSGPKT